jgi:Protein of unknown function (DUF3606)
MGSELLAFIPLTRERGLLTRRNYSMSSLTKKLKPDRSKIDADNSKELKYWTKALGASKGDVLAAIEKVGSSAAAVRKELANGKPLDPDDFPLIADGKDIKKQDGTPISEALDSA